MKKAFDNGIYSNAPAPVWVLSDDDKYCFCSVNGCDFESYSEQAVREHIKLKHLQNKKSKGKEGR